MLIPVLHCFPVGCGHEGQTEAGVLTSCKLSGDLARCWWGLDSSSPHMKSRMVTIEHSLQKKKSVWFCNSRDMILIRAQEKTVCGKKAMAGTLVSG